MSFSYSEISSMMSSKRHRVSQNIDLSELADNFQRASQEFPTLSRMSRYNLEDLILRGNASSFDSQKKALSGKEIDLKFILEARKNYFKIDSNVKEYQFSNEDRLVFEMNSSDFFDGLERSDRDLGAYIKEVCNEMGRSLPEKIALNHKLTGSCTNLDLMNGVQRSCSKKVVPLNDISEKLLKQIGYRSPSSSEINDFAKKIADENRLNIDRDGFGKTFIPTNQLDKISTKAIDEFYLKMPLNSDDERNLEQGFYVLKEIDIIIAKNNKNAFWDRIFTTSRVGRSGDRSNTLQARSKAGYTNDISSLRAGKKILIVGQNSLQKVENKQNESLKKLVELAKICDISLPSDFSTKISVSILKETHNNNNSVQMLEGLSWETIKEIHSYPLKEIRELKKYIEEVIKKCH